MLATDMLSEARTRRLAGFPPCPGGVGQAPPLPGTLMFAVRPWTMGRAFGALLRAALAVLVIVLAVIWSLWTLLGPITFVF